MSALPFFRPPPYPNRLVTGSKCAHEAEFFLPQTFGNFPASAKFKGPSSWHEFDQVRLTIAQNVVLERIVEAANEARSLNCLMADVSLCFRQSFDVMFSGHGLVTFCQIRPEYSQEVDRISDELARLVLGPVSAQYQLTLHWTAIYDRVTQQFDHLQTECSKYLHKLRTMMQDSLLIQYADANAVFKEWWMDRFDEVNKHERLLQNSDVIIQPTVRNVLADISRQVPAGEGVQIITKMDGVYHVVCTLATNVVLLADEGELLAEIERRSSAPEVGLLFENLTLNTRNNNSSMSLV
ncbi:hypothetical protein EPUS_05172 [Endocarpon pusillum Z07020]|uniref:Uncharacterized protein n=1 Tax=Endocarpon pusillum (strain Z07020 / HMAS-L-300199) TaxID=1263415 RepID=U1HZH3_ENDPU|nr:uncharacterized protein EPUS_05172 [Endocarpon pusillum Z07020]ERF74964.1 hypothetical protein EPUS_05172 [Endocarpon pusillum Z07020]